MTINASKSVKNLSCIARYLFLFNFYISHNECDTEISQHNMPLSSQRKNRCVSYPQYSKNIHISTTLIKQIDIRDNISRCNSLGGNNRIY